MLLAPRLSTSLADMLSTELPPCRVIISTCWRWRTVWLPVTASKLSWVPAASWRLSMPAPPLMTKLPLLRLACRLVAVALMRSLPAWAFRSAAVL